MTDAMQECIRDCLDCYQSCLETKTQCIQMGEKHSEPKHLKLMSDCADICIASAQFMMRKSDHHADICNVCSHICEECALNCDKFSEDFMKACAEQCRACAQSCKKMSQGKHA